VTEPGNYTCLARQQGVHPAVRGTIRVVGDECFQSAVLMGLLSTEACECGNGTGNNTPLSFGSVNWQSLTGDHEEVFWNGTNNALCVLSILSIMLSFGAKMYKCCAKKKNSKEGIV
jgi:hypothetical protein